MPDVEDYVESLSGEEIIVDVCALIAQHLRRDCNLRETDSYQGGYRGTVKVKLELYGMDQADVEVEVPLRLGNAQGEPDRAFESEMNIPVEPALNAVRERSDQPIPTLAANEQGETEVRPRRYVRRERMVGGGGATGDAL